MRSLFRRISVFTCTLFWNNGTKICNPIRFVRKYWAQLILSSVAIQTIACAYGGEDVYGDFSSACSPEFNVEKFTNKDYTDCEKDIVEKVLKAKDLQDNFNKREDATLEKWVGVRQEIDKLAETCDMEHLKSEGSLTNYVCGDGKTVDVIDYHP